MFKTKPLGSPAAQKKNENVSSSTKLKIALPKGSLEEATYQIFKKAGFNISVNPRSYFPSIDDPEIEAILFRPQEMSRYIEDGAVDCGLTGHDWILENDSKVIELCDLQYSKRTSKPVRWVLAVHEDSPYRELWRGWPVVVRAPAQQPTTADVATERISTREAVDQTSVKGSREA